MYFPGPGNNPSRLFPKIYPAHRSDALAPPNYPTGLRIQLVRQPKAALANTTYRLSPPVLGGGPPLVTGPLGALVLQHPRPRTISTLRGPVVVTPAPPVVTTLRVKLAESTRTGRRSGYGLAAPTVIGLPPVAPIRVTLAQQKLNRRKTNFRLGGPTVVGPLVVPPLATPTRVALAKWRRPVPTLHQLRIGLTATPTHDCRKPLLTDSTHVAGDLVEATAAHGSLSDSTHVAGTLADSTHVAGTLSVSSGAQGALANATHTAGTLNLASGAQGSLNESSTTRGSLTDSTHMAGTLTNNEDTDGTLTENTGTKGDLTDTC